MELYHYLSKQYALEDLRYRRLKIALLNDLNDPFELLAADYSNERQREILNGWKKAQEKKWGVLCFSKTWKNPIMWSHYADRHKGMVLGFEVADDLLMKVDYTKKRLNIDIQDLFEKGLLNTKLINKMLRTKYEGWRYEEEVRVYASLKVQDQKTGLYYADFNKQMTLKSVIAGPLCDVSEEEILSEVQKEDANIKIIKSSLAFQSFKVIEKTEVF